MNPMGQFNPATYLPPAAPFSTDTGQTWEYIRIINNSPYLLQVTLAGQGSKNIPENFLEDVRITSAYDGKLIITPVANFPGTAISAALSSLALVECYLPGEIQLPVAQPLTTLAAVGGGSLTQATSVVQDGTASPKILVESSPSNYPTITPQSVLLQTDGSLTLTTPSHGGFTPAFKVVPGSSILGGAFSHIEADNGAFLSDGSGNMTAQTLAATAPVKLRTGNQETGKAGGQASNASAGGTFGFPSNFKTNMTNVPSSFTFTPGNVTNATSITANNIDIFGFFLSIVATAAGFSEWRGTYLTIGN